MAEIGGYWKGAAVTRFGRTVLHVYLEQSGSRLTGPYESEDQYPALRGTVTGSIEDTRLNLALENGMDFRGSLSGHPEAQRMIHGTIHYRDEPVPVGTLTLFYGEERAELFGMYTE